MAKVRVHNLTMSLDGYAAGPDQSHDQPLGVGGEGLHEWAFATEAFGALHGSDGDGADLDDRFARRGARPTRQGVSGPTP